MFTSPADLLVLDAALGDRSIQTPASTILVQQRNCANVRRNTRCQGFQLSSGEAAAEIARSGRIRNALSAQGVEVNFILTTQFDVLQAGAVAQGVVSEVEHMIGFVVRHMNQEQVQVAIDGIDEADASRAPMPPWASPWQRSPIS
jgi:hypothetical protein